MINIRTVQKTRAFTFRARLVVCCKKLLYALNPLAVCYAEVLKLSQSGRRVKRTKDKDDEKEEGKEEQDVPLERFP